MSKSTDQPGTLTPSKTTRSRRPGPTTPRPTPGTQTNLKYTVPDTAKGISTLAKLAARRMKNQVTLETLSTFQKKHYGTAGVEEFERNLKNNMKNPTDPNDHEVVDLVMGKKVNDARKTLKQSKKKERDERKNSE